MREGKILHEIDIGNKVICDMCGEDWTNRTESGGFLFGSYGVCPTCAPDFLRKVKGYREEWNIRAWCPAGMSHRDWIIGLRGGNNKIVYKELIIDKHDSEK
jgi:hypothetical protein